MRFSPENILLYLFLELRIDELAEGSGVLDLYRGDEYLFCRIGIDKNRGASFFPALGDGPRVLALYSRGDRSGRTSGHGAARLWRACDEGRDAATG